MVSLLLKMERTEEEFSKWASQEGLTTEVMKVLKMDGFTSLNAMKMLTPQEVKEFFQDTKLLPLAQCLTLKKALAKLSGNPERPCDGARDEYAEQQTERSVETPEKFRFLLLGKTGAGKSKTGNTMLGRDLFTEDIAFSSVTVKCELQKSTRNNIDMEIMDAPGLFDTGKSHETTATVIVQAVAGMYPGPHVILYVINVCRYTEEEFAVYQRLKALFDNDMIRYMIVVFTHGDLVDAKGKTIEYMLESAPSFLKQVLSDCKERYVVFNNNAQNKQPQVERLLSMSRQLMIENNGTPYSCPKYGAIGQGLEEEVARRLAEVEKRELENKRYVQELQEKTHLAEEAIAKERKEFQAKEEERKLQMKMMEERKEQEMQKLKETMEQQQLTLEEQQKKEQALREQFKKELEEFQLEMEQKRQKEQKEMKISEERLAALERSLREEREKEREEEVWKQKQQFVTQQSEIFFTCLRVLLQMMPLMLEAFSDED